MLSRDWLRTSRQDREGSALRVDHPVVELAREERLSRLRHVRWFERKYRRPLTFETKFLRTVLQQGVRRFPLNLRPCLGFARASRPRAWAFWPEDSCGCIKPRAIRLGRIKREFALQWLIENQSPGYSGACWGNHFDYQSRSFYLPKGVPTIVWTSLIGHAFLDAYDLFGEREYLEVAVSACEHILRDLDTSAEGDGICISYIPGQNKQVHNANTLGASLLARTYSHTRNEAYRDLAAKGDSIHGPLSEGGLILVLRRSSESSLG